MRLALVLIGVLPAASASCVQGDFSIADVTRCTFSGLLNAFEPFFDDPLNNGGICNHDAETELILLLGVANSDEAEEKVRDMCATTFETYPSKVPFENIPYINEESRSFLARYFNGGTHWNEEYETEYPTNEEGDPTNILRRDAENIDEFYRREGTFGMVEWPVYLPNFDSCSMNAAYCCWPQDRQANDNNGNCRSPYDQNCIDKDPADNTDLCFVDLDAGKGSTGAKGSGGGFVFPEDDGNVNFKAEGPIHCHGFAWAQDTNDPTAVYKANNLFYVSMYDHMHQRGYVRNIPGAPMCGCAEQMPVVSRSDCTQLDVSQRFKFSYVGGLFTTELTRVYVDFNSCQGINRLGKEDNNDLYAYANRLFLEGKYSYNHLFELGKKLVGDNPKMCRDAEKRFLASKGLVRGYEMDTTAWNQVAGREALAIKGYHVGPFGFARSFEGSQNDIIMRKCATCYESHQTIFYKRLTTVPDGMDILRLLKYSNAEVPGQIWGTDFSIHSTYQDAIAGANAWICPGYRYDRGFPGRCGPYGDVSRQSTLFNRHDYRNDVGFYVEGASPFQDVASSTIGSGMGSTVMADDEYYMSTDAQDIWGMQDDFHFHYEEHTSGDIELVVRVTNITTYSDWTKAGLMIRDSIDPGAPYVAVLVTAARGVVFQWRDEPNGESTSREHYQLVGDVTPVWVRLVKRGDAFFGFTGVDGIAWKEMHTSKMMLDFLNPPVAGLALSCGGGEMAEAVFAGYSNMPYLYPSATPSVTPAPTTIVTIGDIGLVNPALPGSTSYAENFDRYILTSSGADIDGNSDGFHFYSRRHEGDLTVTALVESIDAVDYWTRAGVMIRDSKDPGAKNVFVQLVLRLGVFASYRATTDQSTRVGGRQVKPRSSGWVRISRRGNDFIVSRSVDGIAWDNFNIFNVAMSDPVDVGLALSSHNNKERAKAVFRYLSITGDKHTWPSAAPTETLAPSAHTVGSLDIGNIGNRPGSATYEPASDEYSVMAGGIDIWGKRDGFHFIPFRSKGDFVVTVFVESFNATDISAKAGLMVRDNFDGDSPHASIVLTPGSMGIEVVYRNDYEQKTGSSERTNVMTSSTWLRMDRRAGIITCSRADDVDGSPGDWIEVYPVTTVMFSGSVEVGMVVTSHDLNQYATAVFSNFVLDQVSEYMHPSAAPSETPAPTTRKINSLDVGDVDVDLPGSASHAKYGNTEIYEIIASGSDIGWTRDGFHFIPFRAQGDFTMTVFLESFQHDDPLAKAGIMVRDNLDGHAPHMSVLFTGTNSAYAFYREYFGGPTRGRGHQNEPTLPESVWIRIERDGDYFLCSRSYDGNRWVQFFARTLVLADPVEVGMVATSHNRYAYAHAVFKHFKLEETTPYSHPSAAPSVSSAPSTFNINSIDIRTILPGSASYAENGNVYTIRAAGSDIWSRRDSFHFIPVRMEARDFTATVFVAGIEYPHVWAKAGVMARETLEANSTNVFALLAEEQGPLAQARLEEAKNTGHAAVLNDWWESAWLRIERQANMYTCFRSWDGDQWEEMKAFTVDAMAGSVYIGLALTSHNGNEYSTATFTDFKIEIDST